MVSLGVSPNLCCALLLSFTWARAADYFPPSDRAGGWRAATNAAQVRQFAGMDLPRLEQAWGFAQRCTQNGGFLGVRDGWGGVQRHFGPRGRDAESGQASP